MFVTGSRGRGKSTCMSKVISELYGKGTQLIVTGSTGAAAVNIGHEALEELSDAVYGDLLPNELGNILYPTTAHSAFWTEKSGKWLVQRTQGKWRNGGVVHGLVRETSPAGTQQLSSAKAWAVVRECSGHRACQGSDPGRDFDDRRTVIGDIGRVCEILEARRNGSPVWRPRDGVRWRFSTIDAGGQWNSTESHLLVRKQKLDHHDFERRIGRPRSASQDEHSPRGRSPVWRTSRPHGHEQFDAG